MGISSLRALFEHGGPVMWPLLAASVLALAVIIDRALVFLWEYQRLGSVVAALRPLICKHSWAEAERWCCRHGSLTSLARVYLQQRDQPREVRDDILRREGSLLLAHLEKRLRLLAVLGQISTLLGLLGTFYFMIYRFHPDATAGGQLQQADFFLAIWESFLSTMFGLMIAVPCTAAYHLFEGRADTVSREMSTLVSYLDQWARIPAEHPRAVSPTSEDGQASDNARHPRQAP
jgi:biopolymer transport protein ExbB